MHYKIARPVYALPTHAGRKHNYQHEKALSEDKEIKLYVRPKRRKSNLPDSWETKWIHFKKSWKLRSRVKKQWMKHKQTLFEYEILHNEYPEKYILWKYSNPYWTYIEIGERKTVERLVEEGKLEGQYKKIHYHFNVFKTVDYLECVREVLE